MWLLLKAFWHRGHLKFRMSKCTIRTWRFKSAWNLKIFPHSWHWTSFCLSLSCMRWTCLTKCRLLAVWKSHLSQWKSFTLSWTDLTWVVRWVLPEKHFPHSSHWCFNKGITLSWTLKMWFSRDFFVVKVIPHWSHLQAWSLSCTILMWSSKWHFCEKNFPHLKKSCENENSKNTIMV